MSPPRNSTRASRALLALLVAACFAPTGTGTTDATDTSSTTSPATTEATSTSSSPTTAPDDPTTTAAATTTTTTATTGDLSTGATTEPASECGDGVVEGLEQCDDAADNGPDRPCTPLCQHAVCGDGFVCPGCRAPEECDAGVPDGNANCSADCLALRRFVFASSASYGAKEVAPLDADAACTELATLTGDYPNALFVAFVSTDGFPIVDRLGTSKVPYVLPDGLVVAADTDALLTMPLLRPIDRDEHGTPILSDAGPNLCTDPTILAWTGSTASGDPSPFNCLEWTSMNALQKGLAGNLLATNAQWATLCEQPCDSEARLYCFERAP